MKTRTFMTFALLFGFVCSANAQVFTQASGAVTGTTEQGDGQGLYGGFGLNSDSDPEFNIYRKMSQPGDPAPLSAAENVADNPGEVEWTNVNQRQGVPEGPQNVLTAPGMFIGQKNHQNEAGWVTSNPDEILYLKPLIDNADNGIVTDDSNANAFWDTRFGFMEDPDAYIDFAEPNSGDLDLWTGEFATDAVYAQIHIDRDDSISDQVLQRTGHNGSFKVSAEPSFYPDERGRISQETVKTQAGTGEALERTGFVDAGTGYDDAIEVTWGMRLNDPENEDPFLAREVEFWVKAGSNIVSGVFDPGEEGDPVDPNDDFNDFSDDFFDWENAIPVFFAGAEGRAQGTGGMGIFIPGDFGADGSVDVSDFTRLADNWEEGGTTYSRGDFTQDGWTNIDDATAWADLASDEVKAASIDAIKEDMEAEGDIYDFDGSGATDSADVAMISDLFGIADCTPNMGDFNGDGKIDFNDFLALSTNFGQEGTPEQGDANCDGIINFNDFLALSTNFGQTLGGAATASAVPEPNGLAMIGLGMLSLAAVRRRRS